MPAFPSHDGCALWYDVPGDGAPLVVLPGGPGMDPAYLGDLGDLGGLDRTRRLVLAHPADTLAELQRRILPFFWHTWTPDRLADYRPAWACRLPWLREAFYADSADSADSDTLPDRLARFTAARTPVLVLAGASDGMIGTAPARAVAAAHPDSRLEILPRSGHRPWAEEPARFTAAVMAFLA